jgi:1-acyl-sn-glycerol-3-phosphate acyltransferase
MRPLNKIPCHVIMFHRFHHRENSLARRLPHETPLVVIPSFITGSALLSRVKPAPTAPRLTDSVRPPSAMLRLLRLLLRLLFLFEVYNEGVLATPGPVLLLPNHVSWFDWLFLGVCLDGDWRFVTSSTTARLSPVHRWLMVNRRTFPIDPLSPYAAKHMAEHLQTGGRLVLFPEGRISDTGTLMKLFDGTGFLLNKTGAKVITACLRGASRRPI